MEDSNRNFKLQTCEDFIEVLASKAAVPGGGGAGLSELRLAIWLEA